MSIYKHTVQYYETDRMGITHHSNYIRFMEEARVDFLKNIGWGYDKLEEDGVVSPVVSVNCNYKKTTTFADVIEINIQLAEVTSARLVFNFTMTVKDTVVFTAKSSHCFVANSGVPINIRKQYPEFYNILCKLSQDNSKE